jgi:hypothetical protein
MDRHPNSTQLGTRSRREFRKLMCVTLCENPEWSALAWQECSKSVDALASGAAYRFSRWQLPDGLPHARSARYTTP